MERERGRILQSRGFARLICLLALALNFYVWARSRQMLSNAWGFETGPLVAFVLLGTLAVRQAGNHMGKFCLARHVMVVVSGVYVSFFLYFVCLLLTLDLAALVAPLGFGAAYWAALGLAALVSLYGLFNAGRVVRTDYQVDVGLGRPYRVALLSDLHIGDFVRPRHLEKAVRAANGLDADLILIAGDLFNGHGMRDVSHPDATLAHLKALQAPDGVYAVYGNHDPLPGEEECAAFLQAAGIRLLRDEAVAAGPLCLVGRNDYSRPNLRAPLKALIQGADRPVAVLDHNPWGVDEAAEAGAALVLCGHTHRGQLAPMSLITRRAVGRDYFYGLSRHGHTTCIITSGAGYFGLPMRVGTHCEVVCLTLR